MKSTGKVKFKQIQLAQIVISPPISLLVFLNELSTKNTYMVFQNSWISCIFCENLVTKWPLRSYLWYHFSRENLIFSKLTRYWLKIIQKILAKFLWNRVQALSFGVSLNLKGPPSGLRQFLTTENRKLNGKNFLLEKSKWQMELDLF